MKRIIQFTAGAAAYILLSVLLSSYGNKISHKEFNTYIIKGFESRFVNTAFPIEKFKNYRFIFEGSPLIKGKKVIAGGFKTINEEIRNDNAAGWIIHGGHSADEPELPASFRHFYDPTEPEG